MKPVFFDALNKEGSINEPNLSVESLGRAFGPLQKQVSSSIIFCCFFYCTLKSAV
jgi:programmed cell death 6-interacting protein